MWDALELDRHLGASGRQAFASADVEGNSRPAPVLNEQFERDKGVCGRVGCDPFLFLITHNLLSINYACGVLRTYCPLCHLFRSKQGDGPQDLHLFIADGIRVKGDGWLHRCQAEDLHNVVLYHVTDSPGLLVVLCPRADAQTLSSPNLYMVNVLCIPERLKDPISEAECQQILYSLFAHIVVNTVDLILTEHTAYLAVELLCGGQVASKGFFNNDARPGLVITIFTAVCPC